MRVLEEQPSRQFVVLLVEGAAGDHEADWHGHGACGLVLVIAGPGLARNKSSDEELSTAQAFRIVRRQVFEEGASATRRRGAMAPQGRVHPALGKEDVSRPLDLAQQQQARLDAARPSRREADGADTAALPAPELGGDSQDMSERGEPGVSRSRTSADSASLVNANCALRSGFFVTGGLCLVQDRGSLERHAPPAPARGGRNRSPTASGQARPPAASTPASAIARSLQPSAVSRSAENRTRLHRWRSGAIESAAKDAFSRGAERGARRR